MSSIEAERQFGAAFRAHSANNSAFGETAFNLRAFVEARSRVRKEGAFGTATKVFRCAQGGKEPWIKHRRNNKKEKHFSEAAYVRNFVLLGHYDNMLVRLQ